jgi:predicted Zn-dependent peptidase
VSQTIRRTVLPNGLQVITEAIRSSRTAAIGVFVRVGSRQESATLHGASHFLEHVLFKGTPSRTAEQISSSIESVGGELNAYTAKEHTCFYARVLHSDGALVVDVLSDMISNSLITGRDVDAERAVILDEIAMHGDDPAELVSDLVTAQMHSGVGLGRPVIGSPRSVAEMSRSQIVRHWRRHYRPPSLVVAAAGRVDHDRLVEQIAVLDDRNRGAEPRTPAPTKIDFSGGLVSRQIRLEQSTAMLAFPGPGLFDERRHASGLLALILGGGMASRLFLEVRERRGLTYGIDAGESAYSDAGIWSVDWQCAPGRMQPIVELVRASLLEVAEHGVSEDELARAKGQMRGQTVLSFEGPSSRMSRLGINALLGDHRTLAEILSCFDAVTADEVRQVAAELFGRTPVLGVVGPKPPTRRVAALLGRW